MAWCAAALVRCNMEGTGLVRHWIGALGNGLSGFRRCRHGVRFRYKLLHIIREQAGTIRGNGRLISMQPAKRKHDAMLGRYCAICGHGQSYSKGGLVGANPILQAAGYILPAGMWFAHVKCLELIRRK